MSQGQEMQHVSFYGQQQASAPQNDAYAIQINDYPEVPPPPYHSLPNPTSYHSSLPNPPNYQEATIDIHKECRERETQLIQQNQKDRTSSVLVTLFLTALALIGLYPIFRYFNLF